MTWPARRYETRPLFITAMADMGSAASRNRPGRRHIVRLSAGDHRMVIAAGLSETAAQRMTEIINRFMAEVFDTDHPTTEPPACAQCATPLRRAEQGRPSLYCSPACRQRAYRDRERDRGPLPLTGKFTTSEA